jgi:hypothetical protein
VIRRRKSTSYPEGRIMTHQVDLGFNRTGIATSPRLSAEMVEGMNEFPPDAAGDERAIGIVRTSYAQESEQIGSVPPPATVSGMAAAALQGVRGSHPVQFTDKLAERLAFERTGTRLYQALVSKFDAFGGFEGGPTRSDLEGIMLEELAHFRLLVRVATDIGADPTVVTPSADLAATLARGVLDVVVDPRTTLVQSLEAMLLAELVDNDCWTTLVDLARARDDEQLATTFESALADEDRHLRLVREWLAAAQGRTDGA